MLTKINYSPNYTYSQINSYICDQLLSSWCLDIAAQGHSSGS